MRLITASPMLAFDIVQRPDPCLPRICREAFTCDSRHLNNNEPRHPIVASPMLLTQMDSECSMCMSCTFRLANLGCLYRGRAWWILEATGPPQRLLSWEPLVKVLPGRQACQATCI